LAETGSGHPSIFVINFRAVMDHRVKPGDDEIEILFMAV
jgi:hypothetical protein